MFEQAGIDTKVNLIDLVCEQLIKQNESRAGSVPVTNKIQVHHLLLWSPGRICQAIAPAGQTHSERWFLWSPVQICSFRKYISGSLAPRANLLSLPIGLIATSVDDVSHSLRACVQLTCSDKVYGQEYCYEAQWNPSGSTSGIGSLWEIMKSRMNWIGRGLICTSAYSLKEFSASK